MSATLGIDLSSRFIDLVLLDENADRAEWTRIVLEGGTAFERAREVSEWMPQPGWFEAHGVYLVAVERPFSQSRNDVVRLIEGCVIAEIPRSLDVWEVAPQTWKAHIGFKGRGKPDATSFPGFVRPAYGSAGASMLDGWPQDALDALGAALWARDTNAALVARALGGAA
jgi:hypothetical protein